MEPITHFLTGACIGRAGFNRKTACATVTAVLAAEAADLDILWRFAGPVEELKHHRGITHTFVGAPVVAAVTVGAVWMVCGWRHRRKPPGSQPSTPKNPALPYLLPPQALNFPLLLPAISSLSLHWKHASPRPPRPSLAPPPAAAQAPLNR